MGVLRAIITVVVSVLTVNFIFRNKERLEQYPIFKQVLPFFDNKCYFIIAIMTLVMILW